MTEEVWFLEKTSVKGLRVEWASREVESLLSSEIKEEIGKRVAGLSGFINHTRRFFSKTGIGYAFLDVVIGIGKVRGREGSFHLIIPSMPYEPAWIEFRVDAARLGGVAVQETLADVLESDNGCAENYEVNNYYHDDSTYNGEEE